MLGMERTILPEIAETDFGIAARSAIFSFIVVFGITKAIANYFAGRFAQQFGRKKMLITGWLFGLPVPFILMYAPDWNWIIAAEFGLRPYPFYLGIVLVVLGLLMSIFLVRDTVPFVVYEDKNSESNHVKKNLFKEVSLTDRNLQSVSQAGMMTNFKDGMAWGAFPIFLLAAGLSLTQMGIVVAIYPAFWGILQILTGKLSDYTGRKKCSELVC